MAINEVLASQQKEALRQKSLPVTNEIPATDTKGSCPFLTKAFHKAWNNAAARYQ